MEILNCTIDKNTLTVGEKVRLSCAQPSIPVGSLKLTFKDGNTQSPYEIKFLGDATLNGNVISQAITSYKVGNLELGDLRLMVDTTEYGVSKQNLIVQSVLPKTVGQNQNPAQVQAPGAAGEGADQGLTPPSGTTAAPTPFPIFDPVAVKAPWWWWAMWILLLAVLVSFVAYHLTKWARERSRHSEKVALDKLQTPAEKFKTRLRKLESTGYHLRGEYKSFALELTQILKTGLGEKLKFAAEDLTSEEIILTLEKRYRPFYKIAGEKVVRVLSELDQIKFAKVETHSDNCLALLDQTAKIGHHLFEESP